MKTFLLKIALLASLLTALAACNKSKQDDQPLPPALREEFNCYINGEYWEHTPGGNCSSIDFSYFEGGTGGGPEGYLIMRGEDCPTDDRFIISLDSIKSPVRLTEPKKINSLVFKYETKFEYPHYRFDSLLSVNINIDSLLPQKYDDAVFPDGTPYVDVTNGWIEGTFEMTLMNDLQDTVEISQGKFAAILY